jgi:hypothetical protein
MFDFGFEPGRPVGVLGELLSRLAQRRDRTPGQVLMVPGASARTQQLANSYRDRTRWLWYVGGEVTREEAPLFHDRCRLCLAADAEDPSGTAELSVLALLSRGWGLRRRGSTERPRTRGDASTSSGKGTASAGTCSPPRGCQEEQSTSNVTTHFLGVARRLRAQ